MRAVECVVCIVWRGFSFKVGKTYDVDKNGKFKHVKAPHTWLEYNSYPENSKFRPAYTNDKEEE